MKTLLILCHAKSKPTDPQRPDQDRELAEEGKDGALKTGRLLRSNDLVQDLIISSSALGAKTTAEIVANACEYEVGETNIEHSLYDAKLQDYINIVEKLSDSYICVLLVGHNPTIDETGETLTDTSDAAVSSTCTVAHLSLPIEKWYSLQTKTKTRLF